MCHYISSVCDLTFVHFQYVFDPLFLKIPFGGTCFSISRSVSISTDDAIEFNSINHFKVVVNAPKTLNRSGVRIEMIKKGAIVISTNLGFEISSSVATNPPKKVSPIHVFSDLMKLGIKIK